MKLRCLIIAFIQVAIVESIREVSGYHGGNVTLPSGANASWNLTKIEWSIYTNNTWIATYQGTKKNVNRLHSYKGRLSLNIVTGDLTIHNLKETDDIEYSVDLIDNKEHISSNKIRLALRKQLQQPTVHAVVSNSTYGNCWVMLNCASPDGGVGVRVRVRVVGDPCVTSLTFNDSSSSVDYFALAKTGQKQVKFTCISRRDNEAASTDYMLTCDGPPPPVPHRTPAWLVLFIGGLLGALLTLAVIYREKLKYVFEMAIEKVRPAKK